MSIIIGIVVGLCLLVYANIKTPKSDFFAEEYVNTKMSYWEELCNEPLEVCDNNIVFVDEEELCKMRKLWDYCGANMCDIDECETGIIAKIFGKYVSVEKGLSKEDSPEFWDKYNAAVCNA